MLSLFFPLIAWATTFGPISLVEQMQHSGYVVHGRVRGAPWVEMEPKVRRPFTYWKLEVLEQPLGAQLGSEVSMRQPGGEIGDMGYHVAGAASFQADEEVFVTLRDTDDRDTKEVVGLASGKYRVERDGSGKTRVISGLSLPVTGGGGQPLSAEEFTALLQRVAAHRETEADKNIFINKQPVHEAGEAHVPEAAVAKALPARVSPPPAHEPNLPATPQKSPESTEESSTGSAAGLWVLVGLASLGLLALVILLRR